MDQIVTIHELEARTCNRCILHPDSTPLDLWTKDGFKYHRCQECGLMWVNPQLTDASVAIIYDTGFKAKQGKQAVYPGKRNFREGLQLIAPNKQPESRLLDVGTFTGHFLIAARESGWQHVEGTEIAIKAAEYAREHHQLTIHIGDLLSLDLPANHYDAVTLSDVIEHVSNPLATVQEIFRILRPGGVLYMHTPHFDSLPYRYYGKDWNIFFPWHRMIFSAKAMRVMLESTGYQVPVLRTVGILPLGRENPWKRYEQQRDNPPQPTEAAPVTGWWSQRVTFNQRMRNLLRPMWLGAKQAIELPFYPLSSLGIHLGARLVVCAKKPNESMT